MFVTVTKCECKQFAMARGSRAKASARHDPLPLVLTHVNPLAMHRGGDIGHFCIRPSISQHQDVAASPYGTAA